MSWIPEENYVFMPWKNGKGFTRQIAIHPHHSQFPKDPFLWRLSLAEMSEDGDFSAFPGYERLLVIWEGEGLILNGKRVTRLETIHLPGEPASTAQLIRGPIRDLGLIFNPKEIDAELQIFTGSRKKEKHIEANSDTSLIILLRGQMEINGQIFNHPGTWVGKKHSSFTLGYEGRTVVVFLKITHRQIRSLSRNTYL